MRQRGFRARRREQRAGAKSGALACMYSSALWRTLARKSRQRELGSRWREIRTGAKSTAPARDSRQRAGSRASMSVAPARSRVALARTSRWLAPLRAGAYAAPARRAGRTRRARAAGGRRADTVVDICIYLPLHGMAIDGRCGAVACIRAGVIEADAARGVAGRGTCEKDEGLQLARMPMCSCAARRAKGRARRCYTVMYSCDGE